MKKYCVLIIMLMLIGCLLPVVFAMADVSMDLVSEYQLQFSHMPLTVYKSYSLPNGNLLIEYVTRDGKKRDDRMNRYLEVFDERGNSISLIKIHTYRENDYDGYFRVYFENDGFVCEIYESPHMTLGEIRNYDFFGNLVSKEKKEFKYSEKRYIYSLPSFQISLFPQIEDCSQSAEIRNYLLDISLRYSINYGMTEFFEFDEKLSVISFDDSDRRIIQTFDKNCQLLNTTDALAIQNSTELSFVEDVSVIYIVAKNVADTYDVFLFDKGEMKLKNEVLRFELNDDYSAEGIISFQGGIVLAVKERVKRDESGANGIGLYFLDKKGTLTQLIEPSQCLVRTLSASQKRNVVTMLESGDKQNYYVKAYSINDN